MLVPLDFPPSLSVVLAAEAAAALRFTYAGGSEAEPTMRETQVRSLGREDPLEKETAAHSSNSCLENPIDRGAW